MRRAPVLAAVAVLLASLGARAQETPPRPAPEAPAAPAAGAAEPVQVQMKEVEIRGEVERPEVFYIIPRREARMELAPLSRDYREEIAEPLLPGPFEEWVRSKKR